MKDIDFGGPGEEPITPRAHSISPALCGDKECMSVHILLRDVDGKPMAQATVSFTMLVQWLELSYLAALNFHPEHEHD